MSPSPLSDANPSNQTPSALSDANPANRTPSTMSDATPTDQMPSSDDTPSDQTPFPTSNDDPTILAPAPGATTALAALGGLPIEAVKGVGPEWAAILERSGLGTVSDLAALDDQGLASLLAAQRTRHPIEIRTLARLLDAPLPVLPAIGREAPNLYSATGLLPSELAPLIGVGTETAARLADLLARAYTAMNSRWLQKLPLSTLAAGES